MTEFAEDQYEQIKQSITMNVQEKAEAILGYPDVLVVPEGFTEQRYGGGRYIYEEGSQPDVLYAFMHSGINLPESEYAELLERIFFPEMV